MDSDEIVKEETGEYSETYEMNTPTTGDSLGSALVILTSVFLVLSIILIQLHLYNAYDLLKSEQKIQERENAAKLVKF